MKKILLILFALLIIVSSIVLILIPRKTNPTYQALLKEKYSKKYVPSVDHSKFAVLQKKFKTPQEVTKECETCHNGRAAEVMKSNHWRWEEVVYIPDRGITYLGKKNAINNFCIGAESNEKSCAKCHVGYGMNSVNTFDFNAKENIDCLVCHDNTETYAKASEMGGAPDPNLDFAYIAQHVGKPKRTNCGVCHFYGGGGNNVKHGDLEQALFEPTRDIDVHMGVDGVNMQCVDCHTAEKHNIKGQLYSMSANNTNRALCEDCHKSTPHSEDILNKHTLKVACQTCHIPVYAKVNSTKIEWDWSTAGKLKDGKPYEIDDSLGNHLYLSIKGDFKWGRNLKPEYVWFNGTASHYLLGDEIKDTTKVLILNKLLGAYNDFDSKIIPVKIHRAIQPFDPITRLLIQPKLYSDKPGEGAFWVDFDWKKSAEVGMKEVGLPFSGHISFIRTDMYWPVNHMVSPKEKSVQCTECHNSENSRLANLTDFYMPARDRSNIIETLGTGAILASIFAVLIHGGLRIFSYRRLKNGEKNEK